MQFSVMLTSSLFTCLNVAAVTMKPLAVCFLTATLLFCHLLRANCQSQALRFLGQEPFTAYVSHGASPGQVLYRLLAVVSDSYSNTVTYSLVRPDPTHVALFAVATTGELSITAWIPSSHSEYHLVVRASSPGATVDANFSVIAVSQAITTPRFEHERFVTVVSENRPGNTSVTIVRAFSLDSHGNKNTVGNYTIIRGNENGALCIRQQTGILSTSKPLDREKISMYFLTVRYTDSTGYVEAQVQVSVGDVNDNPPTLSEALYNFTVAETLSQNSIFGLVSAFDPDSGSNGQYVYSLSGLSAEVFSIDSSGQITTQRPLDYEQQTQYQVNVVTTDMGTLRLTASAVVLVNVLNIDDECPLFSGSLYAMEIPYNDMNFPPPLKLILSVMAIDPDKIAPVRYAILSGNDDGVFSLDTTSGSIFLVNNSIGVRGQYELNISASDANCHNKSSIRVVIGIGTTNDHTPTLNKTTCAAKLFENPSPNALVTTLQATDEDFGPGGHVQFAILRGIGEFDLFMVDPESGEIRTANSSKGFDRERTSGFKIGVVATDSGFRQDFCLVEIVLLDLNDNAPLFEVPVYRVSLKMDAAIGDEVIQVLAYDPDQGLNGMVMYSITTPAGCSFTINSTTGSISVSGTVNEAIAGFCHINVTATDQGSEQRSGFALVNITLFHSSQVLPMFMQELYNTSIHENYPTLPSTFLDVHVNSGMSVTYTIANGLSYHSNGESTFGIAPTSGNIFVNSVASKGVDYESLYPGPYYFRLLVTATLSSGLFSVVPVTVTVTDQNDNFPQFPVDSVTSSIREMEPVFSFVSIVQAMDADQGTNGTIIYTISGNLFGVDANGTISLLADNLTATGMPHEISVDAYNPNFKMHADRIRVTVNVEDINNNPPAFSNALYTFAINETQPVYSQIAELPASDPDHSDQDKLIFTIIYGNQEGVFQIMANKQTGILLLSQRLDYESRTEYELTVQVSDGIHTSTANVTISVEDNDDEPPQFSQSNYHGKITENAVAGTSVLQVSATDVDTAQIQFQLTGSALERLNVADNGTVSVSGSIDREQFLPNGELVFVAFAYGGSLDAATITINIADVNDQVPTLLQSPFNGLVPENTDPGTDGLFTVQVSASDHDAGLNGTISYSLLSGEENGFQIDAISGIVSAHRRFDREARQFYTLTVQAEDQGTPLRLSSTANIIVEIGDENDNSPSWRYPYMFTRVFENTTVGNAIFRLPAIDPDKGNNASVIFTNSSNMGELFSLNSTTGEVIVNGLLDYEDQQQSKQFSFNFTIRDDGNPPRINSERGVLVIEILDTNDNRPELSETYLNISLQESTSPGTVLTGFSASDADAGSNGKVSFSIKSGNIQEAFNISVNGDSRASVIVATPLDFETIADYVLTIEAKDGGYPSLSTTAMLNITIADVNDEAPVFSQGVYYATIREESPPVTGFLQVSATDPDSDDLPGGRVSFYQLVSGNDQGKFNFNNASLSAIGSLDREEQAQYTLTIIAVDNDPEQPLTGTATIIIDIMDINDNNSSNGGHLEVVISARDGMVPSEDLGMVYFSDPDDDDQFQNCTIVGGDSQLFKVFSNCSLSAKQNTMGKGVYNLTVQGNDGVHDPVISTVTVRVYHFNPNLLLSESLLIFTLNASGSFYLDSIGPTTLLSRLSSTLQRNISQFINVSVQQGLHNPDSTVDVAIAVQETSGQFVTPTRLIHELFVARQQLQFGSVELFSLATDPCITEPCFNKAQCKAKKTIRGTGNRLASRKTILYSPMVELSYECICLPGSAGKHCEINYNDCYSNPCQYGAPCIDGLQDFFCQCPSGTSGKDCSINVDECLSNPCHNGASCRNGFGAPICECTPGYYGNLCQYSYFRVSQQCDSNPCQNGGTCSPGRDTFTCQCSMMYFGKTCSSQVIFQGGCVSTPCYNGSVCMETINSTACICSVGFTGPLCRFPLDNCELKPCRNGATCETGLYGSYLCVCPPGFTGQDCTEPVPACSSNPCQNGGTCNEGNGTFTCICPKEFTGDHCQTTINPPDLCSASICTSTNGNCTSSQDGYSCTCLPVFSGEDCSINSPPSSPCGSNPCQHGGSCTNTSSTYSCSCPSGFTGQDCEININDCSSASTCINGGTCVDGIMGYTCSCMNGFAGRKCEVHCPLGHIGDRCQTDINYCLDTSCQNGGTCIEQVEGFSCLCPPRFIGPVCNISNDCSQSICHNQGTCMDSPSLGHTCQCDSQLDGSDCELLTVSFQGTTSLPSYRAYKSLDVGGHAALKFEFTTLSTSGLLLLNTQYQQGHSRDIISVEMVNSQLKVLFSLGSEQVTAITVLSSSLNVSDGQWHTVELEVVEKVSVIDQSDSHSYHYIGFCSVLP